MAQCVVEHSPPTQASHQYGPGSIPGLGVKHPLSLLLVLVLVPRGFSPGTPVFPSPQKPKFPNSNSILNWRAQVCQSPSLNKVYLGFISESYIYLFVCLCIYLPHTSYKKMLTQEKRQAKEKVVKNA